MKKQQEVSPEYQKLQAAWVKAAKTGELIVPCQTLSDARRLRFTLYNAVKAVREGKVFDEMLLNAVNSVSLQIKETPVRLIMQHRRNTAPMQALAAVLGEEDLLEVSLQPVMTEEEVESLNRLQGIIAEGGAEPATRKNPYFTREDR